MLIKVLSSRNVALTADVACWSFHLHTSGVIVLKVIKQLYLE